MTRASQTDGLRQAEIGIILNVSSTAKRLKTIATSPSRDSRRAYTFFIAFLSLASEPALSLDACRSQTRFELSHSSNSCSLPPHSVGYNPEGCEKVAGGRSEAKTSGYQIMFFAPRRGARKTVAPLLGAVELLASFPVVFATLRPPATLFHASGVNAPLTNSCLH